MNRIQLLFIFLLAALFVGVMTLPRATPMPGETALIGNGDPTATVIPSEIIPPAQTATPLPPEEGSTRLTRRGFRNFSYTS